jgi:hypothetical protein
LPETMFGRSSNRRITSSRLSPGNRNHFRK